MKVQIGYLSKEYYNSGPDAGGRFPFAIEGEMDYVFEAGGIYLPECNEDWLPLWMEKFGGYPIYFCVEARTWKSYFGNECEEFDLHYTFLPIGSRSAAVVIEVKNVKQFRIIFPLLAHIGSWNETVVWSMNKDVFSVEVREWKGNWEGKKKETIVAKIDKDTSIFWIGYDGDGVSVISNNNQFSTYEGICRTLPPFIKPTLDESQWLD